MKRIASLVLVLTASLAVDLAQAGPPAGSSFGFSKTSTITTTASTVTVPACYTSGAPFQHLKVRAPSTNSDVIYVRPEGTATSADMSIVPGSSEEVSIRSTTVSVISASGTQAVELLSSCR